MLRKNVKFYKWQNGSKMQYLVNLATENHFGVDLSRGKYCKILIATNVLSRGMDCNFIANLVSFDLPQDEFGKADCETYLH